MNTMLDKISLSLKNKNIDFDPYNQRVRCLAHVINLAAKSVLESLHMSGFDSVEEVLESEDNESNLNNTIYKVNCRFNYCIHI
jgi:stalled ribosome rescue protein Dom34